MAGASRVRRNEDIARVDNESLTVTRGEFERPGQRNDVLSLRRIVPVEDRMRRRFLEMYRNHVGAVVKLHRAFTHVRGTVLAGVELECVHRGAVIARLRCPTNRPAAWRMFRFSAIRRWPYRRRYTNRHAPAQRLSPASHVLAPA